MTVLLCISEKICAQWVQVQNGMSTNDVRSIIVNGNDIYAGTGNTSTGYIYHSSNDGNTWTVKGTTAKGVSCFAANGATLYAGTNGGGVYISTDNGTTWTAVNTGLSGFSQTIRSLLIDAGNVYAATTGGLYKTTNNGGSWASVNNSAFYGYQNALAVSGTSVLAGHLQGIVMTSDNGATFTPLNTGLPTSPNVLALCVNGSDIYAGTAKGIYISSNNGSSWTKINNGLTDTTIPSIVKNGSNIMIGCKTATGGSGWGVYVSNNSGASWTQMNQGLVYKGVTALAVNSTYIFEGSIGGHVFRRLLSEMTVGVKENNNTIDFSLYPNPSPGKFKVASTLKATDEFIYSVYNILGEEIITAKNVTVSNGIDLSDSPKGIYFVKITLDKKTSTKRLIIE